MTDPFSTTLVADVGGTNARFQLVVAKDKAPLSFADVRTEDFATLEDAVQHAVLDKLEGNDTPFPTRAIIAAAGPITKDGLDLTNCDWNIRPNVFLALKPFETLILLNDFEAQALSLPYLSPAHLCAIGPSAPERENANKAVLGPGTGLGVGLLAHAGGKWVPVPGEGGHIDLGPRNDRESKLWKHLQTVGGRISAEQILSGPGLQNIYQAICAADGHAVKLETPAEISNAAIRGENAQAVEALDVFCTCLGRIAGDLALTSSARGGVFIAGGIGKKILEYLKSSQFRSAFEDKAPHSKLMHEIATWVVTHDDPALLGLSSFARQPEAFLVDLENRTWHC